MLQTKYFFRLIIFIVSLLVIVTSKTILAQSALVDSLQSNIDSIKDSISILDSHKIQLTKSFDRINEEIYELKSDLKENDNIFSKFNLENLLKKATLYADSISKINTLIESLDADLTKNYEIIINELALLIEQEAGLLKNAKSSKEKVAILNKLHSLEKSKQIYQDLIGNVLPIERKTPPLIIEPDDSIERIKLKINIVKDKISQTQIEEKYLLQRKEELKSDRSIYEEMLSFIHDLKQDIDEEQEFYDQDRVDQLKSKIKKIELKISGIDERLIEIKNEEKNYDELLKKFNEYLKALLGENIK